LGAAAVSEDCLMHRNPADDSAWASLKEEWDLRPGTTYLNHGSFGPPPRKVRNARNSWQARMDQQPMSFFVRELEPAWRSAREKLAHFVGTSGQNLIFVENATVGMNIVADSFQLSAGDEVLLTDHEYGAVFRIWQRACKRAGAHVRVVELPVPFQSAAQTADALLAAATQRTRLIAISHVTSATATVLPVAEVCRQARARGIAVAIDGPHAVAQVPLAIDNLDCDFFAASCHKWLSGPFGSGFLYVAPSRQAAVRPPVLSWGRLPPGSIDGWSDEFVWSGTRNPVAYLAVPAAIEFLEEVGVENFRARTHWLAHYARQKIGALGGLTPLMPDSTEWYGSMAHVPLVRADSNDKCAVSNPLQHAIWERYGIEAPIVDFRGTRYVRVSCHLYNDTEQIDRLAAALEDLVFRGATT
jgi:isopenicillin-N epimerase